MRNFHSIMSSFSLKTRSSKANLRLLYSSPGSDERIYRYENIEFSFVSPSPREIEKPVLLAKFPAGIFGVDGIDPDFAEVYGHFLLRSLAPKINAYSKGLQNRNKDESSKGAAAAQEPNENILARSGCVYSPAENAFALRIACRFPLINGTWIAVKPGLRLIKELMQLLHSGLSGLDFELLARFLETAETKRRIRRFVSGNGLCAFVADGAILPRRDGTNLPLENAVPFSSPERLRVRIPLPGGGEISGMGIPRGVTVITGGGYSGKSTLLDAIEAGIYDKVPGDGREYCVSDRSALKIYAEDGRPVCNLDLSPFFRYLPGADVSRFSTAHASGSVSQAANIVEAVCARCGLLLIDEDKSATNFMIRDEQMRKIVRREPIIPFTDRVRELHERMDVSTVLVIGGSGEYLKYADRVLLMEDYAASDITAQVAGSGLCPPRAAEPPANWTGARQLAVKDGGLPFSYFRSVLSENAKKIVLDSHSADITLLTALVSESQLSALVYIMERLLTHTDFCGADLLAAAETITREIFSPEADDRAAALHFKPEGWLEEVRPIDVFCCASRMRGLEINAFVF